jgi:hypothetical protein
LELLFKGAIPIGVIPMDAELIQLIDMKQDTKQKKQATRRRTKLILQPQGTTRYKRQK